MNVLKAYAHQVVSFHPARLRDEMFEELYDNLCEEYADWQSTHPAGTETEFLDECKEHPMRYATRLAPEGSAWLIGPQFYYSFISALKAAITVTSVFYLVLAIVGALASRNWAASIIGALFDLPGTLLWVCAAILGVFVALERTGERAVWLDRWKARDLAPADSHDQISRGEVFFDLAVSTFGLLLVLGVIPLPPMVRHDDTWLSGWGLAVPALAIWAAGVLFAFDIGFAVRCLTRTLWTRRLRLVAVTVNLVWIALLGWAALHSPLVTLATEEPDLVNLARVVDHAVRGILVVVCAVLAFDTIGHARRLLRPRPA